MTAALTISDLHVELGGATIVESVSMSVEAGRWVSIIGPNGAGKTTLLRAALGLIPFTGSVAVDGVELAGRPPRERARLMSLVPQQPELPAATRVVDYVLLGRTPHLPPLGRESSTDLEIVASVLERLDLGALGDRHLGTLSGGERQRTVIARALSQQAPVLLLDEPTTALDLGHQQEVLALVEELRRTDGLTVLSTMHDLTVAGDHADQLVLLADGQVVVQGDSATVLDAEVLERVYGTEVEIVSHGGRRIVLPRPTNGNHA